MEMEMKKPENKTNAVSSSCFSEVSRARARRTEKWHEERQDTPVKAFRKRVLRAE